jgi:hypothetical protein
MDILFDGVAIDCSGENFLVKTACVQMKEKDEIRSINETHLAFSVFGRVSLPHEEVKQKIIKKLYVFYLVRQTQAVSVALLCIVACKTSQNWVRLSLLMVKRKLTCGMASVTR